jgi:hypothetical protein
MSSRYSSPARQAKLNAIKNIKSCIDALNTYDDSGVLYDIVKVENDKPIQLVTLTDVKEIYKSTTLKYPASSLLPPEYRNYLEDGNNTPKYVEGALYGTNVGDFVEALLRALQLRVDSEEDDGGIPLPTTDTFREAVAYYDNHTTGAIKFILSKSDDDYMRLLDEAFP